MEANFTRPTDDIMPPNSRRTPPGPVYRGPTEPINRLVRSSFSRLSSGFRVADPRDDRAVMELSDALQARLRDKGRASPSAALLDAHAAPAMSGVLARMRALAEGTDPAQPPRLSANDEFSSLIAQLREGLESAERAAKDPHGLAAADVGPGANAAAAVSMMQRLMGAIARARALEGNLAGAATPAEEITRAEEMLILARAQALLEEGVARFTQTPLRPRARQLLN